MKINPWIKTFRSWSLLTLWKICISASSISESQIKLTLQSHWSDVLDPSHFGAKVCLISSTLHLNFFIPLCSHIPILQGEVCNITLVQNHVYTPSCSDPFTSTTRLPTSDQSHICNQTVIFYFAMYMLQHFLTFPDISRRFTNKKCMQEVFF